uniref:Acyl-CoA thioesterase n=1 Tax=Panagrolaimus sp. JU765 TaxID=591449 RepID=A0AC34R721_9BILA
MLFRTQRFLSSPFLAAFFKPPFCFFSRQTRLQFIQRLSTSCQNFCINLAPPGKPLELRPGKSPIMSTQEIVTEELLKIFILDKEDDNTYVANHLGDGTWLTKNVYGGALFAQSLVAAQKTVGSEFLPHSIHSLFILNVSPLKPVIYKTQRIRDGRSFCTRFITAHQNDKIVYSTQISFHVKEEGAITHQTEMPKVIEPEKCKASWDLAREFLEKAESGHLKVSPHVALAMQATIDDQKNALVEFRPIDPEHQFALIPHKPKTYYYWTKVRTKLSDDREQHRALAAYITDATLASTANRPHVSHGYTPSMLVSLDNNTWFHTDDYRADEWMLYENESPIAQNGRAFSLGKLWTRDGRLILSSAQESLSRTKVAKSSL